MGRPCSGDIHVRVGSHFYHGGALALRRCFPPKIHFGFCKGLDDSYVGRPHTLFLRGARQIWRPVSDLSVRRYLGACSVWLSVGVRDAGWWSEVAGRMSGENGGKKDDVRKRPKD